MVSEICKKISENLERLSAKTKVLSVKLVSFVISCWLVIGSLMFGIVLPVYVVKFAVKAYGSVETKAANVLLEQQPVNKELMRQRYYQARLSLRNYGVTPVRLQETQSALKSGIRSLASR